MDCLDTLRADVQSLIVARTTIRCRMTRTIAQRIVYRMTRKTVSAVTNKQNQENESNLKLFSSNWLGSDVDIEILQSENKATKTIRDLMLTSGERPPIVTTDKELDIPMKQWYVLEIKNNALYPKRANDVESIFFFTIKRSEIN